MKFGNKIGAILLLVGILPILGIGVLSLGASRDELVAAVQKAEQGSAEHLARYTESVVVHAITSLNLTAQTLPLKTFSNDELTQVLRIPLRQVGAVTAIALLGADGVAIVPPIFEPELGRGEPSIKEMATHVPLAEALSTGTAIGPPYRAADGSARVVIAVRNGELIVAAELSLLSAIAHFEEQKVHGSTVILLDALGAPLSGTRSLSSSERALVIDRVANGTIVEGADAEPTVAGFAVARTLGWGVLSERPLKLAQAGADRVRDRTAYWALVALVVAGALSFWLARGISHPLADLSRVAKALSEGRYDEPLPAPGGKDELAVFAGTFRHMADEIRRRDIEIGAWNRQLQARVEERTGELKAAEDQIARSRRLAALGTMGAGIAHELNNPLAGVLGLVSLVKMNLAPESEDAVMLQTAIEQARRMSKIIERLRDLIEAENADAGTITQLQRVVLASLKTFRTRLTDGKIEVSTRFAEQVPNIQGNEDQLLDLVGHLVANAANAMPQGGRLEICVTSVEGQAVKLTVADTGPGIPAELRERIFDPFFTTKDDPGHSNVGLGLSVCSQIVRKHHGRLSVHSELGKGSTFSVVLPAATDKPHLV